MKNRFENTFALASALLVLTVWQGRAETAFWSDNFEGNVTSRWTTGSVWHIGAPTAGPAVNVNGFRTYSGTNCASTQNYPYSQDARLVCTNYNGTNWLVVPPGSQSPRLRFWQWFNYEVYNTNPNALGYVEVYNGTNWQQISPTYVSPVGNGSFTGGGVWSRPSIDLSDFAGQSVQIAFHFTSGCCVGNALGWFVDDVAVVTNMPVLNLPESFEAGPNTNDWAVDFGTWQIGRPTGGPATNAAGLRAHSGTNCAATTLAGSYANNVDSRLISPPFLVPASGSASLRFWQWYSFVNALGFVEIYNGTLSVANTTNITITTNTITSLNTNIYQLFGAAVAGYDTPFYWNPAIGGWTNNANKAMGNVFAFSGQYFFEAGNAPLASVNGAIFDYRANVVPFPQSAAATNFSVWEGMTWNSPTLVTDNPVGYFGTNYSYTYTTNTTVTTSGSSWQTVPQTLIESANSTVVASGGWVSSVIDLSTYAGQTVQMAFHFTSGGIYSSAGWYVDDIGFIAAPMLIVPTNLTINAGQTLTTTISATNSVEPAATFTFGLVPPSTNVWLTTNGVLTLTNTAALIGTNVIKVEATDNNVPPLSTTNSFSVTVLPPVRPALSISNAPAGSHVFQFSFQTWSNTTWRIVAATNLASTNWLPVFTNTAGAGGTLQFTDALATNFTRRFYRAVFP